MLQLSITWLPLFIAFFMLKLSTGLVLGPLYICGAGNGICSTPHLLTFPDLFTIPFRTRNNPVVRRISWSPQFDTLWLQGVTEVEAAAEK